MVNPPEKLRRKTTSTDSVLVWPNPPVSLTPFICGNDRSSWFLRMVGLVKKDRDASIWYRRGLEVWSDAKFPMKKGLVTLAFRLVAMVLLRVELKFQYCN